MIGSEYFSGAPADNDAGSHRVGPFLYDAATDGTDQLRHLVGAAPANHVDSSNIWLSLSVLYPLHNCIAEISV